jgi:hypothetical protein
VSLDNFAIWNFNNLKIWRLIWYSVPSDEYESGLSISGYPPFALRYCYVSGIKSFATTSDLGSRYTPLLLSYRDFAKLKLRSDFGLQPITQSHITYHISHNHQSRINIIILLLPPNPPKEGFCIWVMKKNIILTENFPSTHITLSHNHISTNHISTNHISTNHKFPMSDVQCSIIVVNQ